MLTLIASREFEEHYQNLPSAIQRKIEKQEALFIHNPFHSSLRTEKLSPKHKGLWSFRVDKKYRVLFRFIDHDTALLLTVGLHDWIYRINW